MTFDYPTHTGIGHIKYPNKFSVHMKFQISALQDTVQDMAYSPIPDVSVKFPSLNQLDMYII